jgi:hypothetical protein
MGHREVDIMALLPTSTKTLQVFRDEEDWINVSNKDNNTTLRTPIQHCHICEGIKHNVTHEGILTAIGRATIQTRKCYHGE